MASDIKGPAVIDFPLLGAPFIILRIGKWLYLFELDGHLLFKRIV